MSGRLPRAHDRVAVVIPARDQSANLPVCLRAVLTAALCVPLPVTVVVVLDAADDAGSGLAGRYGPDVHFISVDADDADTARAVGFAYARSLFPAEARCWYATTDAETRVDPGWLVGQLGADADTNLMDTAPTRARARDPHGLARYPGQPGRSVAGDRV
jgi:hypothetical protein